MKKVLLIDDDKSIRDSTTELLKIVGYNVKAAENGAKGIKLAKEFIPDIIICDIAMPILDGYSVFNELSKTPETSVIPFIFLTAKVEMNDMKYGMQLGVDDYICKPFSSNDLINSIELRLKKKDDIINSFINKKTPEVKHSNSQELNNFDKDSHILLMVGNHPQNFKIGNIVYIESLEKYSKVHTSDGKKVVVRKMLKNWEEILPKSVFMRIHRKTIINLDYVIKFEKWFNYSYRVFIDKITEPFIVSRRNSEKLRKA